MNLIKLHRTLLSLAACAAAFLAPTEARMAAAQDAVRSTSGLDTPRISRIDPNGDRGLHGPMNHANCYFYGGDLGQHGALPSERSLGGYEAWAFDDVSWPGGAVSEVWGNFAARVGAIPIAGDFIIYQGMSPGVFGTLIHEASDVSSFTWRRTGRRFGMTNEFELRLQVAPFYLPPGNYHVGVRPVMTTDSSIVITMSQGTNSHGSPIGNGNSYLQSDRWGYATPAPAEAFLGPGTWDVSFGIGHPLGVSVMGSVPGVIEVQVSNATPGGHVGFITGQSGGQFMIPPPTCAGITLPLRNPQLVTTVRADANGDVSVRGNVSRPIHLVIIDATTCCWTAIPIP